MMISRQLASNVTLATHCARRPALRLGTPRFHARTQLPRFQSTLTNASSNSSRSTSSALIGALTGSLTTCTIGYLWYRQSGARELLTATKTTKDYVSSASKKLKETTPEPNEALQWLRDAATSYATFIPGARGYVDTAFDDLDAIRAKHSDEVDNIVREAYGELRDVVGKGDVSLLTAQRAWSVIVKYLGQIGDVSGDAAQQIMDNHPKFKEKIGGNLDKLKDMGRNYGPEAKKEVDKTWAQIGDIIKTGPTPENIEMVKKVVQEKLNKVRQIGDEAWKKGMEQAKPYLDKNPKVKELIEENADTLKQGNVQELYQKIKQAVEKGDTGALDNYVKSATDQAKQSGFGGLDQYLKKMPGGDQVISKLNQLHEVAQEHGDEAQMILKDAMDEISEILKKKGDEAEKLVKRVEEESKK